MAVAQTKDEARKLTIAALIPKVREKMKRDPYGWIRTFVRIEDPDHGIVPFMLWEGQHKALDTFTDERLVIVLKARQLGLTWLALAYAVWCLLTRPGFKVVGLSKGEDEAKELIRRVKVILRNLPPMFCVQGNKPMGDIPAWDGSTEQIYIFHPGGADTGFKAFPSAPDSARAFTGGLVIIDEWAAQPYAEEIFTAAFPTINRPEGGKVIGLSTGQRGTFFEKVWNGAVDGSMPFSPVFLNWRTDPRRTDEWFARTKKVMPHSWRQEYPANPEDAFAAGEGAAFTEWDEDVHIAFGKEWEPPANWKIYRCYDGGYMSRAACVWIAQSPDGWAVAYREYYPKMVTDKEQAKTIIELSRRKDGTPEHISWTIADPANWQKRSATGISTAEVFAREGVPLRKGDNDRINGWKRLHEWLKPFPGPDGKLMAQLRFTGSCVNTKRTIPSLVVDKNKPDDVDTLGEDHIADSLRYWTQSRPSAPLSEKEANARRERRRRVVKPVISSQTGY